jgi:uncharacterized protein with PIN domain
MRQHQAIAINEVATVICYHCKKQFKEESKNALTDTYPLSPLDLIEECPHCKACGGVYCMDQHGNIIRDEK